MIRAYKGEEGGWWLQSSGPTMKELFDYRPQYFRFIAFDLRSDRTAQHKGIEKGRFLDESGARRIERHVAMIVEDMALDALRDKEVLGTPVPVWAQEYQDDYDAICESVDEL